MKLTTIVSFILDESGSMDSIKKSVISGFNEYISSLKKQKGNFLFTLTKFDSMRIKTVSLNKPIKEIKPLTDYSYEPGAMTPLYDAVVETVEKVHEQTKQMEEKPAVLVAIMTDGLENASHKHNQKCLADLIAKLNKEGNWTFVFMGANQDSWAVAQQFGISKGNIFNWQATDQGTENVFRSMSENTAYFSSEMCVSASGNVSDGSSLHSDNFFINSKNKGGVK